MTLDPLDTEILLRVLRDPRTQEAAIAHYGAAQLRKLIEQLETPQPKG